MTRRSLIATTMFVVCLSNVAVGWHLGYRSPVPFLLFWLFCALLVVTAGRVTKRLFPATDFPATIIRTAVVAFAIIVVCGLVLGAVSSLTPAWYLTSLTALAAGTFFLKRKPAGTPVPDPASRRRIALLVVAAVMVPIVAFVAGFGFTHSPMTLYDSLSYHLVFPARWLLDRQLSIVPTPFSDEAQAYQPANGELWFLWLMLPFHGDLIARIGQLPFLLLTGIALFAIARRAGAKPEHAVYAPAFCFLSRPIIEQGTGADVDLVCAAMFLTSVYLGIVALDTDERRDWVLWGVSLGLYFGSKYLALVFTPVFLLLAVMRGPRAKVIWALPGVAMLALPWYLRNWFIAGSPIYPATLKVAGITIARGAYTREAMLNSVFHTNDPRLFPVMAGHAFGAPLLLFWIPVALAAAWSVVRDRRWWPGGFLLVVPLLMVPLYWFGLPVNIDSRFLLAAVAIAMLSFALAFRTGTKWNACLHGFYAGGVIWILVGVNGEISAPVPWFMRDWLTLQGIVGHQSLYLFAAFSLVASSAWYICCFSQRMTIAALTVVASAGSAIVAVGSDVWCVPSRCDVLQVSSPYIRSSFVDGWRWAAEHLSQTTIAYTGNNVPYPLFGERLTNRVCYVNIDHHLTWRFHDYDRAQRRRQGSTPASPRLATSSGELMPVSQHDGPHEDASRPRYERMEGYRDAWIQNLKALGVGAVFISALSAYEIDYMWHDADGFPIEQEWAKEDPQAFGLVYENPQVRIYDVNVSRVSRVSRVSGVSGVSSASRDR